LQTTGGTPYSFSYAYNLDGGMSSTTFPSGRVLTYGFDGAGRVDAVSGVLNSNTTTTFNTSTPISYAPQGAIASMTFGNGLTESTTFNGKLQPTQIQAGSLLTLQYGYHRPRITETCRARRSRGAVGRQRKAIRAATME